MFYKSSENILSNTFISATKLKWIKDITRDFEELNIVYIKILQAICINGNLFNTEQMNYLIKYTDNVPYVPDEKDLSFLKDLDLHW